MSSSTEKAANTERFHVLAQLEHLQSRYTGCGHADTNRWDWLTNQHRDTSASIVGHPDHLSYMAVANNYSRERARVEQLDKMIQPCGAPPKRTPLDDL
uniref:Splicing factor subunit n=1 Tax=Panagrellus redivivus TaxID=6233 RepID=A0A7E4V2Z2_PANRE